MLFTVTSMHHPSDRVRLFFRVEDALATAVQGQDVIEVAVHYDALLHRLLPLGTPHEGVGRDWTVPAEYQDEGIVIALGSIPIELFGVPTRSRQALKDGDSHLLSS